MSDRIQFMKTCTQLQKSRPQFMETDYIIYTASISIRTVTERWVYCN